MKTLIITLFSLFSVQALAAHLPGGIYICKIAGFDKKTVTAACNVRKPDVYKKIPREWVDLEKNLKVGLVISVVMTEEQEAKWYAINKKGAKGDAK